MKEIDKKILCDFCGEKVSFSITKQVFVKTDKKNVFGNILANMCESCEADKKKKTIHNQYIKAQYTKNDFIKDITEEKGEV